MAKLSGLGRGLESLIPTKPQKTVVINPKLKGENVFYIEVNKIRPNSRQPRRNFDETSLNELAASIKKYGILQPLLVAKVEEENEKGINVEYELIAGERRWRAAKLAGLPSVPVIVKDNFDQDRMKLEVALIENIQRQDLNAIEQAEAYAQLANEFGLNHNEIAGRVGKARESVSNSIRLLGLPANIKESLRAGRISFSHGRSLLQFKNPKRMQEAFQQILAGKLRSDDLEASARIASPETSRVPKSIRLMARFGELQDNLSRHFDTPVLIKTGVQGGRIEIKFADIEELNKLAKIILD